MTENPASNTDTPPTLKILKDLIGSTREAVLITGSDLRIIAANSPAVKSFSRFSFPLEGRRLVEAVRDVTLHAAVTKALETGEASNFRLQLPGPERKSFDVNVGPIDVGGMRAAAVMFYDITEIERLENVRQEFLSNISHELRTPLTSILAYVETLEDGAMEDEENGRRFLAVIRKNAERMHSLISDIMELSMIESGNVSVEVRPVRLCHIVDEVFASLSAAAEKQRIDFINEVPPDATVAADPMRLEQMLTNLVDNAVKFGRPEGSVTVALDRNNGSDIISVADTGEGIAPEPLRRIFERFYRVDRARSREVGGTGLGLSIVKHLAKIQGGEVRAESVPGEGTTFFIELPSRGPSPDS